MAEAADAPPGDPVIDKIMLALDKSRLFRYHNDEPVALLSTAGRVLMAILEDPTMTQRAISVYLGCSESLVDKTMKTLIDAGMVSKTKVSRQNVYSIDTDSIENHSDIRHLALVLASLRREPVVEDDSAW